MQAEDFKKTPPKKDGKGEAKRASSGKKKSGSRSANLAEAKKRGRQLRSAQQKNKPTEMIKLFEGLTMEDLQKQATGVCLAYDDAMLSPLCDWDKKYPENPDRLHSVYERCQYYGLVDRCDKLEARKASEKELLLGHSQKYIDTVKSSAKMNTKQLMELSSKYDGIYFHKDTYDAALMAAGCTLEVVDNVCSGKSKHGMALVRPPGHHAMYDEACGYCFFNNVAIAAKHAVEDLGLERVLVIDWDVHHGQGTQYLFYDDPRVVYFSIHRWEHGNFWPNLRESSHDFIGKDKGTGFNVNVPVNETGLTNSDYLAIFQQVLLPLAYEYNPQLIIVSAGYDAAIGCPEGENDVTPAMYAHFINMLKALADGKLAVILEGGYCLKSLAESAAMTLRALLDDPCPSIGPTVKPHDSVVASILNVIGALRPYWQCFQYQGSAEEGEEPEILHQYKAPEGVVFASQENRPEKFEIYGDYIIHPEEKEVKMNALVEDLISRTSLPSYQNRTCIVYDERMRQHRAITMPGHPERPDRIKRIYEKHRDCGLLERCKVLESRFATIEEISLCHEKDYIEKVQSYKEYKPKELLEEEYKYNSIFLSPEVYECATLATGCALNVVDEVCTKQSQNGLAIIRPPGHHAEIHEACGFCYFNTAAVAARYAQHKHALKKVLILDWDVHHGNGTQHIFEDDPSVLYISLHRHDNGFFFPAGDGGDYHQVGRGAGIGFNVNIPYNQRAMGDSEYIASFQQLVMPIAYEFCPDLVIISAGFDAARGDPLGMMNITPEGYAHMTQMLLGLAEGRVILLLEGGYNLNSISESMAMCTSVLLGHQCPALQPVQPCKHAVDSICNTLDVHKQYWQSLQYRVDLPGKPSEVKLEPMELAPTSVIFGSESSDSDIEKLTEKVQEMNVNEPSGSGDNPEGDAKPGSVKVEEQAVAGGSQGGAVGGPVGGTGSGDSLVEGAVGGIPMNKTVSEQFKEFLGKAVEGQDDVQMYAVTPLTWCAHVKEVTNVPEGGLNVQDPCVECRHVGENWVCLTCYQVHCSRYINEHMLFHGLETEHRMVLSYADLSVWCYGCDHYVNHASGQPAKRAAHISKFGEDVPQPDDE